MRSIRRGTREMDLILGNYARCRLASMDGVALDVYEALLRESDQELYAWVTGQARAPERYLGLIEDIAAHLGAGRARCV
ncbi:MAG: succinate dehydrogenase assembly factor 2 [Rhodobacter sp.]|nr:succinate dehydrogenase assembly factor 2 [Rhodobacter sp.]MCY4241774.1 succinate dehydrogenase assembly factor 2 [Rhodobacter sp.]